MTFIYAVLIYLAISFSLSLLLVILLTASYYCRRKRLIRKIQKNAETIRELNLQRDDLLSRISTDKKD